MTTKKDALPKLPNSERAILEIPFEDNNSCAITEVILQPIQEKTSENTAVIASRQVSFFKDFKNSVGNYEISTIIHDIQSGKYKSEIERIRECIKENIHTEADTLKKKLPAFTPSGTFENGRKIELLSTYSGCVILDIDKLEPEQLIEAKNKAIALPYTYSAFISPSGNGLKIIVLSDQDREHHANAIAQISNYYFNELKVQIDPSGKDVSRLCFVSYDPDCYFNPLAEKFSVKQSIDFRQKVSDAVKGYSPKLNDTGSDFSDCVRFTEQITSYHQGNRNNFIHQLACNCNRKGISEQTALSLIRQHYDLDDNELTATVQSAYKSNAMEFANLANFADFANSASVLGLKKIDNNVTLTGMPYLPEEIFNSLPYILKEGCKAFDNKRERDVFLSGAIGIISGCMPNVIGYYNGKKVYANLYIFIVAPPATGKGALNFSKELGNEYHDLLKRKSDELQKRYDIEIEEYKRNQFKDESERTEKPKEPPFKILYIPANNSSARVIQHLMENDEQGIFCETEADTMGNVLKQDWGSYSDLLRKAFHHEPISYSRKTNNVFFEVKHPRLSVVLAGTPGQVVNLIKSAEDGLFSRFLFYTFRSEIEWIDAGEFVNGFNLTDHFHSLSLSVLEFVEFLNSTPEITYKLTPGQWKKLNDFGRSCINNLTTFISEDMASTAKRFGLILYRVSMIITALRYFDNGETPINMKCSDDDFDIALKLVNVLQEHSAFMYGNLPKESSTTDNAINRFFKMLPDNFLRKKAVEIGIASGIKERTVDNYLKKLASNELLVQPKLGVYNKVTTS